MKKTVRQVIIAVGSLILGIAATIALVLYSIEDNKIQAITLPQRGGYSVQNGFILNLSAQNDGNILYEHKGYVFENNELIPAESFITDEYDIPINYLNEKMIMRASFNGLKYKDKIWYESLYNGFGGFNIYPTIYKNKIIIQHENNYYNTVLLDMTTGETNSLFGEPEKKGMENELLERSALHWCEIIAVSEDGRYFIYSTNRNYFLKKENIQMESWSPLMRGAVMDIPLLQELSSKYQRSISQIVLRWNIQNGVVVIPKSFTPSRIKENFEIFDFVIDQADMLRIDSLNENIRTGADPDNFDF